MNILVINCGSSSLKFQLIDSESEKCLGKGLCERIGEAKGVVNFTPDGGDKISLEKPLPDHKSAFDAVIAQLTDENTGIIKDMKEVGAVGHRVVHGGEYFSESVVIDDDVIKKIEACNSLAPLHNPANIIGIKASMEVMPGIKNVAVFDTAFHQTMDKKAYLYAIPNEYYEKYKIRRYGFHGTSHSFVSKRAAELVNKPYDKVKTIVCHIGNGASICAVENGKSVDTSMGLTPLAGVVMGTRSGDIDPSIVDVIAREENLTTADVIDILNKKSGVTALSGISADFRDISGAIENGDERAKVAMEAYAHAIVRYVGAYAAVMNGVDVIAFTAGVGENQIMLREMVMSHLEYLGVKINKEANNTRSKEIMISSEDSKVKVFVIPTNEELAIARETLELI